MVYTQYLNNFAPAPNFVLDTALVNKLIDNSNYLFNKASYVNPVTTAPTAITQATSGTPSLLLSYTLANNQLNELFTFTGALGFSAQVANSVSFLLYKNGVLVAPAISFRAVFGATTVVSEEFLIAIEKDASASPATNTYDLKWQIKLGTPNLTATLAQGFRVVHWQI